MTERPGDPATGGPVTGGPATGGPASGRPATACPVPAGNPGGIALVVVLGALSAFGPLCLDMYLPALPQLAPALRSTDAAAQLTLSACIVGLALGQLLVGPLSDRVGRRGPLLAGVAMFAVVSAGCALTTSMTLLVVLRLVQGVAGAAGIVVGRAVVADRYAGRAAASYFAAMAAVNGLGPILSPVIGGQLLRVGSWRMIFWVLAGIGVALVVATWLVVRESLPSGSRASGGLGGVFGAFGTVLRDRVYVGFTLTGCLIAAAMFGYISGSPFLLQDGFGLSPQQFSVCFAGNGIGIILATWVGRALLRYVGSATILTAGLVQAAIGAILLLAAVALRLGLWPVLVAFFVMVSAVGLALPHSSALAMDRHRGIAGAASAIFGVVQWALAALAAPLVGIGDRAAGTAVGVTAVAAVGLGAAALVLARRAPLGIIR